MKRFLIAAVFVALVGCVAAPEARAWGCEGHQTVALIAEMHLSPNALAMVNKILKDNPIDPALKRYCKPVSTDPMADAATWADDYREDHPETEGWHFFDIPRGAKRRDIDKYCDVSASCITAALKAQIAILKSPTADAAKKADALRFVIHFAGDIHQPLHCTTNNDQGGNCVPVGYFGSEPATRTVVSKHPGPPYTPHNVIAYYPNLHQVWDSRILERLSQGKTVDQFAAQRAVNAKDYLVTEQGIDPSRISVATGTTNGQTVENYLVPSGATFTNDVQGTTPVDETAMKPQERKPLPQRH